MAALSQLFVTNCSTVASSSHNEHQFIQNTRRCEKEESRIRKRKNINLWTQIVPDDNRI